jgi:hypothetical protein
MTEFSEYPEGKTIDVKLDWIKNLDAGSLQGPKKFGELFVGYLNVLREVQEYFSLIDTEKVAKILEKTGMRLEGFIDPIASHVIRVNGISTAEEAVRINRSAQDQTYKNLNEICNLLAPFQLRVLKPPASSSNSKELQELYSQIEAVYRNAKASEAQIKQVAEMASDEASKLGVAQEARHFSVESARHVENSKNWFWGVIAISVSLLVTSVYFYFFDQPPTSEKIAWNHFIPRFSFLGLLIFIDFMLIGIYRAERHNAVVNKHRANALNTFETMTAATLTQDVKDAVTLTAAGAIYAPQDTGYSKKTANSLNSAADILSAIQSPKD